ncbi:Fkbp14 [Symbiodinium necroappetens]|uniref:peptidylprolyl isomerase n=1 Tax=Symbiodinium necroappetens TaxID=1628268 RepID=A0A812YWB4_9DINO|nr:Fkbp14 [Symbiodinium necroappetens]
MEMSFDQDDEDQQLDEAATAIMLRRLPCKLMIDSFLEILNQFWPGRYNFVYVPHDKSRARNVALAFVNFTDSESARMAYAYFQGRAHPMDIRLGRHIRVCQADVQGLNLNLAYFIARSGFSDMGNPHAPRVFENGRRIDLVEAVQKHVTMQLVAQAGRHMKAVDDVRARREAPKDRRKDASVPLVPQAPGRHAWHSDQDDSSGSSTRRRASEDGTDPSGGSSSSHSPVSIRARDSFLLFDEQRVLDTGDGDLVHVHYTSFLKKEGAQFESTRGGDPYVFKLGKCKDHSKPECMKGFQSALLGMCAGEKRKATVPPKLGFDKKARPSGIRSDEHVIFHLEMVDIDKA